MLDYGRLVWRRRGHKRNCDKTWNYWYYALPMSKPEWGSQQTPLQVVTTW